MKRLVLTLLVLAVAAPVLAACGRSGPPRPPGPADQITYPRTYPAR
jgi:predicted small lipoprotein YifL